ncbi:unnamed protein product [Parascedosporium putredinis]|uniref:Uncharacterized protein n=1 Tax=Parascedosporium putredinis TaxID=1442378 RepID=A0A9P1H6R7_9PEZI|nr:unnamed protein product [Parascedosporium putredinis]CAI7999067.1 unnamed protein product [Parascedosporium putredinis]
MALPQLPQLARAVTERPGDLPTKRLDDEVEFVSEKPVKRRKLEHPRPLAISIPTPQSSYEEGTAVTAPRVILAPLADTGHPGNARPAAGNGAGTDTGAETPTSRSDNVVSPISYATSRDNFSKIASKQWTTAYPRVGTGAFGY